MDPAQLQKETNNDVHSLEQGEQAAEAQPSAQTTSNQATNAPEPSEDAIDATKEGQKAAPTNPFKHRSFIRRLWGKLNIYLLLFVLVLVIAVGTTISLTVKSKKDSQKVINSQELSPDDLKKLANTDVAVGTANQILTIQANAVFAGSALLRGGLDVAGDLTLGGDLTLKNLNVSGAATISELKVTNLDIGKNLNIGSNLTVQGTLTLKGGLSVPGQSNFNGGIVASSVSTGALQLNGDLKLTQHILVGGSIPDIAKGAALGGGGTASLNGSDTSGSIAINTGSSPPAGCFAVVTFSKAFDDTPHVIVTPVGAAAGGIDYYVTRDTTTFSICTATPAPSGQTFGFDYLVLG